MITVKQAKSDIASMLEELNRQGLRVEAVNVSWSTEAVLPVPGSKAAEDVKVIDPQTRCSIGFEAKL